MRWSVFKTMLIRFVMLSAPILLALAMHPIWRFLTGKNGSIGIAIFSMLINAFVTPLYLLLIQKHIVISGEVSLNKRLFRFFLLTVICAASIHWSQQIQLWNWVSATELLEEPDSSTLMIAQIEQYASTTIFVIGIAVGYFAMLVKYDSSKEQ